MIFIGQNTDIGFPRYYNHHSKWADIRCVPRWLHIWWNNKKKNEPVWQIIEWMYGYRKPNCNKCEKMFIEDNRYISTQQERINLVNRLSQRGKFL